MNWEADDFSWAVTNQTCNKHTTPMEEKQERKKKNTILQSPPYNLRKNRKSVALNLGWECYFLLSSLCICQPSAFSVSLGSVLLSSETLPLCALWTHKVQLATAAPQPNPHPSEEHTIKWSKFSASLLRLRPTSKMKKKKKQPHVKVTVNNVCELLCHQSNQ